LAGMAIRGAALARLVPLLLCYLNVNSTGYYKYKSLKDAHVALAERYPDLTGGQNKGAWAGETADRIMVCMNHARRLHVPIRWEQAVGGKTLSSTEISRLEELRDAVDHEATRGMLLLSRPGGCCF